MEFCRIPRPENRERTERARSRERYGRDRERRRSRSPRERRRSPPPFRERYSSYGPPDFGQYPPRGGMGGFRGPPPEPGMERGRGGMMGGQSGPRSHRPALLEPPYPLPSSNGPSSGRFSPGVLLPRGGPPEGGGGYGGSRSEPRDSFGGPPPPRDRFPSGPGKFRGRRAM